ncbi:CRISPR-associated endoribonuclease Cas6 [soil metagenome]|jgi:CRISPR-associated endoribonuclease Cas6|nr:CRISPR-associated endoribonuclease Cas6 [Acidobacteriota bacterium]
MRLHFTLSPNTKPVPFDYQHWLTGVFHKWLADNDLHDKISLYSLSWLDGSRRVVNRLEFPNGASWFVSFYEDEYVEKLVNGALSDPEMFCGMRVLQIRQQTTPDFGTKYKFKVASPVFAKGKTPANGKPPHHYLFNEPETDAILTATLIHKMDVANREADEVRFTGADKQVKVGFDREFANPKIKLVRIKDTDHKASICPIIVEGTPKAVRFAWNVGIGNSTGSCFGALA